MTGSDWRSYEIKYIDYQNFIELDNVDYKSTEIGFVLYNIFFVLLGLDFWSFNIFTKCLCFVISISFLRKYTNNNYAWGLLLFYSLFSLYNYIDFPMRNLISGVIYCYSYQYIYKKKLVRYLICVGIAALFHTSALLLLPVYFLYNTILTKRKIYISLAIIFVFVVIFQESMKTIFANWELLSRLTSGRGLVYIGDTESNMYVGKYFSLGMLVRLLLFILLVEKREQIIQFTKYGNFLIYLSYIYMITYIIGLGIPVLHRLALFVYVPYLACLSFLPFIIKKHKVVYCSFLLMISFLIMTTVITSSYKFIPYTNYISYMFSTKPDFKYRSEYNYLHSPHNKN
jgi:hypothetical protein